ncbi:DedA family protein [Lysinibacillus louembei]|uniref:DedA family protein n=1 Tax=Lysinibacillus louembei TaxID=1470088 RepID=A0ABZ0S207_9BACI|nr:DedA family protein [Lysinibacillus louembei]WPK13672.1 DedA family protein [Lysinibacillus louembei]
MDEVVRLLETYSYVLIIFSLFFGIVGIPAPEESLIFLVGLFVGYGRLNLALSIICSLSSVYIGLLTAYAVGRWLGYPFMKRFGKFIGLTERNLEIVSTGFQRNALRTVVFGIFIPGVRQLSPYVAGVSRLPFKRYTVYALIATIVWVIPFLIAGRILGSVFHIGPEVAPYMGIGIGVICIVYILWKRRKKLRLK